MWAKIKQFFHDSETIFMARLEVILGFVTAALGGIDWTPLLSAGTVPDFSVNLAVNIGVIMIIKGLLLEWARRRRDPELVTK